LKGAFAPALPGAVLPPKMDAAEKTYKLTCPHDKGGGDKMIVKINNNNVSVTIPKTINVNDGGQRKTRSGDKFTFKWFNHKQVIASTLPSLPGTIVAEAKPIIFATVSHAFFNSRMNDQIEQTAMSKLVTELMQEAQTMLLQQTVEQGCNAVLSINCNISTDSTGDKGNSKIVIVTLIGTPCVVVTNNNVSAVSTTAEAILVPEMSYYG